ncbi:MAG: 3TM-type holin, partial [Aquidulcibacter sp.]
KLSRWAAFRIGSGEVPMIGALLPALVPILGDALKRLFPDAEARQRAEAELNAALLARAGELEKAAADIIKAEAQSEHWLAACWRPILMLTFGLLIVARWLGWSAPGISEAEALKLWNIVEIGLGGYVIGRSAEKTLPRIVEVLRR